MLVDPVRIRVDVQSKNEGEGMKKVVTVTLGSSKKDFEFKTKFLGQEFSVQPLRRR
jgi:hypothetical protein